jgi:hypothetical protein
MALTKAKIVAAIAEYIIKNGPVTHTELEARAQTFTWYTLARFDIVMETIHRHPQISTSVRDDDVYYKKKVSRPRKAPSTSHLDWINKPGNYPRMDEMAGIHAVFEEYDKSCSCSMWCSREQLIDLKKEKKHYHMCNLDPVRAERISNLYNTYYGRESDPDKDNQKTPEQGSLLLA